MNIVINEYQNNVSANKLVKQFYEQYAKKLLSYTKNNYSVSEDDAWNLVYKTIYKMADVYDKYEFENEQKQSAFIFKTHINYLRNFFRDNKTFEAKNLEVNLDEKYISEKEELQTKENLQLEVLQQELNRLQEWERILLLMRGQDMPYSDIAKFVDKPEKHLKVYYARLKKQLLLSVNEALEKLNGANDEKNKTQLLTGGDLDKLMNRAFLNLDFSQPLNQKLMESISDNALNKTNILPSFNKIIFNKLILFISACVFLDGLSGYLKEKETLSTVLVSIPEAPKILNKHFIKVIEPVIIQEKAEQIKNNTTRNKKKTGNIVGEEIQEKMTLSGIIQSAKTTERLKGAAVYRLNSNINATSTDQGYYSLQLPKGENIIGVSLIGYQTFTFTIFIEESANKDLVLKETWKALDEITVQNNGYVFPNLTEKEKKANEKEKQKMARLAARSKQEMQRREEKYPFIPIPPDHAFASFNLGSNEVTNLEYRTFLFDLLINGKKEEFLVAKPVQDLWINADGVHFFDTLTRIYFSEKKYNSFPVVNISVKGAQMYCDWLAEQANVIRRKEGKREISVRLPQEHEWLYAAGGGHPGAVYPWPSDSIQNRYNWFLANCCIQKKSDKFRYPFNKTEKYPNGRPSKFDPNAYTSAGMALTNNRIATVEVFAYNPNDFYLYCMCGNASEMVYGGDKKTVKAKGGNWSSDFEHLKLNSEDEFKTINPSPMIGFRLCITVEK